MSDPSRAYSDPATSFFDNYLKLLHKHAIPTKQRRWYVKHVEAFINAQNGRKIKALSGADIKIHLDVLGRENLLLGWHFLQSVTI